MSRLVGVPSYDSESGTFRIVFEGDWPADGFHVYQVAKGWKAYTDPEGRHLRGYEFPDLPKHYPELMRRRVEFPTLPFKLKTDKLVEMNLYEALQWAHEQYVQRKRPAAAAKPAAKAPAPAGRPATAESAAAPAPAGTAEGAAPAAEAAMHAVTYHAGGVTRTVHLPHGYNLLDGAIDNDIPVEFDCKAGVCDTCRVEVIRGAENMTPPTDEEFVMLGEEAVKKGSRLSCQALVQGPVEVRQEPR